MSEQAHLLRGCGSLLVRLVLCLLGAARLLLCVSSLGCHVVACNVSVEVVVNRKQAGRVMTLA